jgi:hypothetical protein
LLPFLFWSKLAMRGGRSEKGDKRMSLKLKEKQDTPTPVKTGLTWLLLIVDRSGSMARIKTDMEGGIQQLFKDQAEVEGDCLVTKVQFDTEYEVLTTNTPVGEIESYELIPRGSTALFDAIGRGVSALESETKGMRVTPDNVIVSIVTDGLENSSREWRSAAIKELIEKKIADGWHFLYLGADQNAITVAGAMGIPVGSSLDFTPDPDHVHTAYASMSANVTNTRRTGKGQSYTRSDRDGSALPKDRNA